MSDSSALNIQQVYGPGFTPTNNLHAFQGLLLRYYAAAAFQPPDGSPGPHGPLAVAWADLYQAHADAVVDAVHLARVSEETAHRLVLASLALCRDHQRWVIESGAPAAANRLAEVLAPILFRLEQWVATADRAGDEHQPHPVENVDHDPAPTGTVNQRMLEAMQQNPESVAWSQRTWADHLGCSPSAVAGADAWQAVLRAREMERRSRRDGAH
jgi:hypothetical protein